MKTSVILFIVSVGLFIGGSAVLSHQTPSKAKPKPQAKDVVVRVSDPKPFPINPYGIEDRVDSAAQLLIKKNQLADVEINQGDFKQWTVVINKLSIGDRPLWKEYLIWNENVHPPFEIDGSQTNKEKCLITVWSIAVEVLKKGGTQPTSVPFVESTTKIESINGKNVTKYVLRFKGESEKTLQLTISFKNR